MVIVKLDVFAVDPAPSVTRTVIAALPTAVGVPEISPVEVLRDKPAGSVPLKREYVLVPVPPEEEIPVREYEELYVPDKPELGVVIANAAVIVNDC